MIVSHKYKYIFLKPRKVAGTSVQVALAKHCGDEDIVTPTSSYTKDVDATAYDDNARNFEGYFNHMRPWRLQQKLSAEEWDGYFKFSIVRNPWDMLVSRYFWNMRGLVPQMSPMEVIRKEIGRSPFNIDSWGKLFFAVKRELTGGRLKEDDTFEDFLKKLPHNVSNTSYYFDKKNNEICDFVIRFEHLDEDYKKLCEQVGVPYEPLPSLKTKTRKSRDYREFYTDETREWVAKEFAKEIEHFGYTFEGTKSE